MFLPASKVFLFAHAIYYFVTLILLHSSSASATIGSATNYSRRQLRRQKEGESSILSIPLTNINESTTSSSIPLTDTNECCDISEYPMCFVGIAKCCSSNRQWVCPNGDTDEYNCPLGEEDGKEGCSEGNSGDNNINNNDDGKCDPERKPGENGTPFCADGVTCCPDGTWSCGIGDGTFACGQGENDIDDHDEDDDDGDDDDACCDPKMKPGVGSNPICSDGVACCPDGTWSCGIGNGSFVCGEESELRTEIPTGRICGEEEEIDNNDDNCCDLSKSIICLGAARALCCPEGEWACPDTEIGGPFSNYQCPISGLTTNKEMNGKYCEKEDDNSSGNNDNDNGNCCDASIPTLCLGGGKALCCPEGQWACTESSEIVGPFSKYKCPISGMMNANDMYGKICNQEEEEEEDNDIVTIMPIDDYYAPDDETCCDPFLEPGVLSNPKSFEGHRCCPDGSWGNSIGDAKNFACGNQIILYPNGKVCDICSLPPEVGPCEALIPSWYFNSETGMCEEFGYGGCDGNANKFKTKKDCEQLCPRNSCCDGNLSPKCRNNGLAKCCPEGEWSCPDNEGYYMCDGDRLEILREGPICDTLPDNSDVDICSFPVDAGPCEAIFPSWYFNVESGKCEEFDYGGCDGNDNRFKSKNDCEEFCPSTTMDHNNIDGENGMDNMEENHNNMNIYDIDDIVYCAVDCSSVPGDPCGDGMAQLSSCTTTTGRETSVVGCALATCERLCEGMNMEIDVDNITDGVYCFPPPKVGMMAMYMQKEIAEISAISRGCEGTHLMQDNMFMIGAMHMACNGAYKEDGVVFTADGSSSNKDNEKENDPTTAVPWQPFPTSSSVKNSITSRTTMTILSLFSLFLFY